MRGLIKMVPGARGAYLRAPVGFVFLDRQITLGKFSFQEKTLWAELVHFALQPLYTPRSILRAGMEVIA